MSIGSGTGASCLLFLQIELQGAKEPDLPRRLFSYTYLIFSRLGEIPVTLVLSEAETWTETGAMTCATSWERIGRMRVLFFRGRVLG